MTLSMPRLLALVTLAALAGGVSAQQHASQPLVETLAADALGGRLTGSEGERMAADVIVAELEQMGAAPLPGQAGFRLPFGFTAGVDDAGSRLTLGGEPATRWAEASQVQALSFSDNGSVTGPVMFAGYGLSVPESGEFGYDSYATLDVTDKIVLVLRYVPEDADPDVRAILSRYSGLRYKALAARERGAKAILVVTGPRSPNAGETVPMTFDTAISGSGIVAASVGGDVAAALFAHVPDTTLEQAQAALDSANPHVAGFEIPGVELTIETRVTREQRQANNIVGYLPATAEAVATDKAYVLLGAHYDHLGRGGNGSSLARKEEAGGIHNGADDNASGVAAVLLAGRQLARAARARHVLLAFWSGEELGVLGSSDFVRSQPVAMDAIAAYLNFDMVGRLTDDKLVMQAVGSSAAWPALLEQLNADAGFDLQLQDDPYLPTDVSSLNQAGVPSLNFFTGSHADYHRPTDDPERINYEGLDRIAAFGAAAARRIANMVDAPAFVQVARSSAGGGDRDTLRVFTGTIPDYTTEVEGLLLSGVIEGGPADQAALTGGDVIVQFGSQTIANIYDYTYALDAVKVDEPLTVIYIRDGERRETTLTPRARR